MLFVWVVSQSGRSLPGQSPGRLGHDRRARSRQRARARPAGRSRALHPRSVRAVHASVLRDARRRHGDHERQLDGRRSAARHGARRAAALDRASAGTPRRAAGRPALRAAAVSAGAPDGFDGPGRGGPPPGGPFGRGGGDRFARPAPIMVDGRLAGVVVVPPQAPFGFLLGRFAPMLALVAAGVLIVGAVLTSAMIFGPARRRLRALETAARKLGAGDLSARAPDRGGDEIAAVASAFNAMADDLSARAEALAASDRVRRQLLADVSHELTTPVTAMRGYLETLTMPELTLDEATRGRYLDDHQRRNEPPRAPDRRAARSGAPRGRRRLAAGRARAGRRALRPRRRRGTSARAQSAGVDAADRDRAGRRARSPAIAIGWSRRCRTWRPTRSATRRAAARCG